MAGPDLTPPGQAPTPPPTSQPMASPELSPPTSLAASGAAGGIPPAVLIGAGTLLVLAVSVVLLLPQWVNPGPDKPQETRPAETAVSTPTTKVSQETAVDAEQADLRELYASLLKRQAALETEQAPAWAPDAWESILSSISQGEQALGKGRGRDAEKHYQSALDALNTLPDSRRQRFESALEAATVAFQAVDAETALREYGIAAAANPESELAQQGLKRAETIAEVASTTQRAEAHERSGALQDALSAYRKAAALDPLYEPAVAGAERISEVLAKQHFRQEMSVLLAAIDKGDLKAARSALKQARSLNGDSEELRDAQRRIDAIAQSRRLSQIRSTALSQEKQENWPAARSSYQQALKIHPASSFAQDGLERVDDLIALNKKMDHYLARPELLRAEGARKTVGNLLLIANAQTSGRPKLSLKAQKLKQLRNAAAVPVKVILRSDGQTEVTVYRVARLGAFDEHVLTLTPGRYTAVGSRDGYRDARVVFTVDAAGRLPPVVVRCEERI